MKYAHIMLLMAMSLALFVSGCGEPQPKAAHPQMENRNLAELRIGDLVDDVSMPTALNGYGLVGGLSGKGSSECPVEIRDYLRKYAQTHLKESGVKLEELIRDMNTTVVHIEGIIPPGLRKDGRFDIRVEPVNAIQTRSLIGGRLYTSELVPMGRPFASASPMGSAKGAVFVNKLDGPPDELEGWVLGGGVFRGENPLVLVLKRPDYKDAANIRNRINVGFGQAVAVARNPHMIELTVPDRFKGREQEMVKFIMALYLIENQDLRARRIAVLTEQLQNPQTRDDAESTLAAIGRPAANSLRPFLTAADPSLRLAAAKIMASFRDREAFTTLRAIANDTTSPDRLNAINAIALWADPDQKKSLLTALLDDPRVDIRMAAYEELVVTGSPAIHRKLIGRFFFDEIVSNGPKMIYVFRSGAPRIAVFGFGQSLKGDVFLETTGGAVILNAPEDSETVTVIRGKRHEYDIVAVPLPSTRLLNDVVTTLSSIPETIGDKIRFNGLNVPYSDTIDVLKGLCEKGYLDAQFVAGPLPIPLD